jgi:hypothetical protein
MDRLEAAELIDLEQAQEMALKPAGFDIRRFQKPKVLRLPKTKEQALAQEFWLYMKDGIKEYNEYVAVHPENKKLKPFTFPALLKMIYRKGWQFFQEEFTKVQKGENVKSPFRLFLYKYGQVKVPTTAVNAPQA